MEGAVWQETEVVSRNRKWSLDHSQRQRGGLGPTPEAAEFCEQSRELEWDLLLPRRSHPS